MSFFAWVDPHRKDFLNVNFFTATWERRSPRLHRYQMSNWIESIFCYFHFRFKRLFCCTFVRLVAIAFSMYFQDARAPICESLLCSLSTTNLPFDSCLHSKQRDSFIIWSYIWNRFGFDFIGISGVDFDFLRFSAAFNRRDSPNEFTNSSFILPKCIAIVKWVRDNEVNYFGTKLIKFVWQRHRIHSTYPTCAQIHSIRVNANETHSHVVISLHQQCTDESRTCAEHFQYHAHVWKYGASLHCILFERE